MGNHLEKAQKQRRTTRAEPTANPDNRAEDVLEQAKHTLECFTDTVERAKEGARRALAEQLKRDLKKPERKEMGINDHYYLALGNTPVEKRKTAVDFLRIRYVSFMKGLLIDEPNHQGEISYALLRSGVPRDKKILVRDKSGPRQMSVEQLIFYPLEHINEFYDQDSVEWIVLLALEAKKEGRVVPLKTADGKTVTLDELIHLCDEKFRYSYFPETLSLDQKKKMDIFKDISICRNLHKLHALMLNAVVNKDTSTIEKNTAFIFERIQHELRTPMNSPVERMHALSHLLTPLTELPENFPFAPEQKQLLCQAMAHIAKDIHDLQQDVPVGEFAHSLDVLNHFPRSWLSVK